MKLVCKVEATYCDHSNVTSSLLSHCDQFLKPHLQNNYRCYHLVNVFNAEVDFTFIVRLVWLSTKLVTLSSLEITKAFIENIQMDIMIRNILELIAMEYHYFKNIRTYYSHNISGK
jgi:hypothetical protein